MFCLLDKTFCQVCVCISMADKSFLDKKADTGWRTWPGNLLKSDLSHVISGIALQRGIFSVQVSSAGAKWLLKAWD